MFQEQRLEMPPKDVALVFLLQRWVFFRSLGLLLLLFSPKNQRRRGWSVEGKFVFTRILWVQKTKMVNTLPMIMTTASSAKKTINTMAVVFGMIWFYFTICFFLSLFSFFQEQFQKKLLMFIKEVYEPYQSQIDFLRTTAEGKHVIARPISVI